MELDRRLEIADGARRLLDRVEQEIVDSWSDLLPQSRVWPQDHRLRARAAVRAALEGILGVIEHSDLDDRTWARIRSDVLANGHLSLDEAQEVLRSVRIVGVDALMDGIEGGEALTPEERWELQQRADAFCDQLFRERPDPDPGSLQRLLAELEADGPDLG